MTGPASPAEELSPWERRAYGKPLKVGMVRHVTATTPAGAVSTDAYESPYLTATEAWQLACRSLADNELPHTTKVLDDGYQLTYTDRWGNHIETTYTHMETAS